MIGWRHHRRPARWRSSSTKGDSAVGHAGRAALPRVRAGRRHRDAEGHDAPHRLRVHGAAAPGHGVPVRIREGDPEMRVASMKGMKPTTGSGDVPVQQHDGLDRRIRGGARGGRQGPMGAAHDRVMKSRVFDPHSYDPDVAVARRGEHAIPHGRTLRNEFPDPDRGRGRRHSPRPAGAIWSNVQDMSRYVMTELSGGVAPGGRASSPRRTSRSAASRRPGCRTS